MTDERLVAIQDVAEDSHLWRALRATASAWSAAWATSRVGRFAAAAARAHGSAAHRVRAGAVIVAWACAWHVAALAVLPRYVTSGLPRLWFVAAAVLGVFVAVFAEALVRAWGTSALARLVRLALGTPATAARCD